MGDFMLFRDAIDIICSLDSERVPVSDFVSDQGPTLSECFHYSFIRLSWGQISSITILRSLISSSNQSWTTGFCVILDL